MALVIEDGSNVANATSYITVDYLKAYALARGRDLSAETDETLEPHIVKAMDRIEARNGQYKGRDTYDAQFTAFPRYGMYLYGRAIPSPYDQIPEGVKRAQAEYALASFDGLDLMPTVNEANVKREKVGPIETEYFEPAPYAPVVQMAEEYLQPFLAHTGLYSVRV